MLLDQRIQHLGDGFTQGSGLERRYGQQKCPTFSPDPTSIKSRRAAYLGLKKVESPDGILNPSLVPDSLIAATCGGCGLLAHDARVVADSPCMDEVIKGSRR